MKRKIAPDASGLKKIESNIRDELIKTGYPLELEVASILEQKLQTDPSWKVEYNSYYFDLEENKGREIDILLNKYYDMERDTGSPIFRIAPHIMIECKKTERDAWVFFTRKSRRIGYWWEWGQYFDSFQLAMRFEPVDTLMYNFIDWAERNLRYFKTDRIANTYAQVVTDKPKLAGKSEIFEAIVQLMKAISYECAYRVDKWGPKLDDVIFFYMPVIVFDGLLYEANVVGKELSLKTADHILLKSYYNPNFINLFGKSQIFFIEIVKRDFFINWLDQMKVDIDKLGEVTKYRGIVQERLKLRKKVYEKP